MFVSAGFVKVDVEFNILKGKFVTGNVVFILWLRKE